MVCLVHGLGLILSFLLWPLSPGNRCPPAPTIPFAVPDTVLATAGTTVTYRCHPGYAFRHGDTLTVTCDGQSWSYDGQLCYGVCKVQRTSITAAAATTSTSANVLIPEQMQVSVTNKNCL